MMKVLNLLASGKTGGIEVLCKNIMLKSNGDNRICCLFEEGEIYNELKEQSKKIFSTVDMKKNLIKITNFLVEYCKIEQIDVIIIHHSGLACNIVYLMMMRRLKNVKFVRYLHECFNSDPFIKNEKKIIKIFLERKFMGKALEKSDLILYISKAVKKSFENAFNIKNKKNIVIYNGIPNNFFETNKNIVKENSINITYIGRLEKIKGVNLLVEAFEKVLKKNKNIRLIITGDGNERDNLEKKVKELNIGSFVEFTGRKQNVIPILDISNIFIYPSICEEGFGISVIEAMSRGCIPITFNKGGLPEIINDGENGIIVNEINSESLAKAIDKVINMNDEEKNKMSYEAKKRAEDFSIDRTIKLLEETLKTL